MTDFWDSKLDSIADIGGGVFPPFPPFWILDFEKGENKKDFNLLNVIELSLSLSFKSLKNNGIEIDSIYEITGLLNVNLNLLYL